jgi:hypothetical protein
MAIVGVAQLSAGQLSSPVQTGSAASSSAGSSPALSLDTIEKRPEALPTYTSDFLASTTSSSIWPNCDPRSFNNQCINTENQITKTIETSSIGILFAGVTVLVLLPVSVPVAVVAAAAVVVGGAAAWAAHALGF